MHRDERSGSCRSLSPPICEPEHYNRAAKNHKRPQIRADLRSSAFICG
jgi:hypothetical protein